MMSGERNPANDRDDRPTGSQEEREAGTKAQTSDPSIGPGTRPGDDAAGDDESPASPGGRP